MKQAALFASVALGFVLFLTGPASARQPADPRVEPVVILEEKVILKKYMEVV